MSGEASRMDGSAAALEAENLRLREALRFYADPASYDHIGPHGTVKGTAWRIIADNGDTARAALGET